MKTKKKRSLQKRENFSGYCFIMPWLLGFFIFTLIPMIFSAVLSLCEWDIVTGLSTIKFVGIDNYKNLFADAKFWQSLKVTFKFCIITIPCYQLISLLIAFLLTLDRRAHV